MEPLQFVEVNKT